MMNSRRFNATGSTMFAALSLSSLLVLSACEERPYPKAASSYAEQPKAPPPAQLAGAPVAPPAYAPPPPPVAYAPPPPPPVYAPPPRVSYEPPVIVAMAPIPNPGQPGSEGYYPGYHGRGHGYGALPPSYDTGYAPPPRHPTYTKPTPPAYVPPAPKTYAAKPTPPVYTKPAPPKTYAAAPPKPTPPVVKPYTPPKDYHPPVAPPKTYAATPPAPKPTPPAYTPPKPNTYAQKGAAAGAATGAAAGAVVAAAKPDAKAIASTAKAAYDDKKAPAGAPNTPAKVGQDVKAAAAATVAAAKVAGADAKATAKTATADAKAAYDANKPGATPPAAGGNADRSTRLAALQSASTDAISKGAVLTAPDRFTANQPADVSLTIPASFGETLRNEAQKDNLTGAAASVNMGVVLSGDGYSVTPDETQSQPLIAGQDTVFRWTVTAQPGAKGPLHADVVADLLGDGSDTLALGSVQKQGGLGIKATPQVVGAVILFLILVLVVAWLAQGRTPARPAAARRASRGARSGARPLDMGVGEESSH